MTIPERREWVRTKVIQPEYAKPRESKKRIDGEKELPKDLPPYVSQRWIRSLNQPDCEEFYPTSDNKRHDAQMPTRFNEETYREYSVSLDATKVVSPKALTGSRVCIMVDSTVKNGRPFHCLLEDIVCFPLPCANIEQMFTAFKEFYGIRESVSSEEAKKRMPQHLIISNVIDHLAQKNLLEGVLHNDEKTTGAAIVELVRTMQGVKRECEKHELPVSFIGPPGFQTWPMALQIVMLCTKEVCKKKGIYFTYGACNLPIHVDSLRLHEVSYPAFFATMSRLVQNHPRPSIAKNLVRESLNLTLDDAMCYSHGVDAVIRAETIQNGEVTKSEVTNLQQEFTLVRGADENAEVRANIHDLVDEGFKRLNALPKSESTTPMNCFPEVRPNLTEPPSAGIKLIKESFKELTGHMIKGGYSQNEFERMTTESLTRFCARNGTLEMKHLIHEIGHSWGPVIVNRLYGMDIEQASEYLKILGHITVREMLALQLAVGSSIMAKGPVEVVKFLFDDDNPLQLFTLIVLTGNQYEQVKRIYALFMTASPEAMPEIIRRRENQLLSWIYNSQIHISGVVEDASRVCTRGRGGRFEEDPNRLIFAGFFFPHNLATLMNAEVRDLLAFIAPVILPIFGAVTAFCYPALPVRIALGGKNFSLLRYVMGGESISLVEKEFQSLVAPMAYAMLKTDEMTRFNIERIRRTRHNKSYSIASELGAVEWVHGPIDRHKDDCAQFINVDWSVVKNLLKGVYRDLMMYNTNIQQELTRMKYLDATIGSNLSEHPLNGMTPRYNMRRYLRQKMGLGLRDPVVRNRYVETHQNINKHVKALQGKIEKVGLKKDHKMQIHKELYSLEDVAGWSVGPVKLKNLPPIVMNMLQAAYKMDITKWKGLEEELFKGDSTK